MIFDGYTMSGIFFQDSLAHMNFVPFQLCTGKSCQFSLQIQEFS